MTYITIAIDGSVRSYPSEEAALEDSVKLNKADEDHPIFILYKLQGRSFEGYDSMGLSATYLGELHREFGTDEYTWKKKA